MGKNYNLASFLLKSITKLAQTKEQVFSNFAAMVHIPWCPYSLVLVGKQVPASVGLGSRQEESRCPALGKQIPVCEKPQAREREHTFDANIYPGAKWGDRSSTSLDTNGAVTWNSHYASQPIVETLFQLWTHNLQGRRFECNDYLIATYHLNKQ